MNKIYFENSVKPLFSVVTVVYNSVNEIEETIHSVQYQSYDQVEYIIIDGLSTDGTIELINTLKNEKTIVINEADQGIYDAMNKSLRLATGDFLIFLNAGDVFYSKDTLSLLSDKIKSGNAVYYGDALYKYGHSDKLVKRGGIFSKYSLSKTNFCHQTLFYPKNIYKEFSYDLQYKMQADYAYNIRIFPLTDFNYVDQIISIYDAQGLSSYTQDHSFRRDQMKLIYKYLGMGALISRVFEGIKNRFYSLQKKI